jgi:hypothetical protein
MGRCPMTPADGLTREQVERLKPLASYDAHTVFLDHNRSALGVYTALAIMIDTDAALRATIKRLKTMSTVEMMCENENVKAHVEEWEVRCLKAEAQLAACEQRVSVKAQLLELEEEKVARLEQALAVCEKERDRAITVCMNLTKLETMSQAEVDAISEEFTMVQYLRQALATAQARINELEERLEIGFAYDAMGIRIEVPKDGPDGIACRDATIELLDAEIRRLRNTRCE